MMDLLFRPKDKLNNTNDGIIQEIKSLFEGHMLSPSGSIVPFVQQAHVEHPMDVIVQFTPIFEENFCGTYGPAPDAVTT